jgi:hypothetical protein
VMAARAASASPPAPFAFMSPPAPSAFMSLISKSIRIWWPCVGLNFIFVDLSEFLWLCLRFQIQIIYRSHLFGVPVWEQLPQIKNTVPASPNGGAGAPAGLFGATVAHALVHGGNLIELRHPRSCWAVAVTGLLRSALCKD